MPVLLAVGVVLGVVLRLLAALHGHNFDLDSYMIVAQIVAHGQNVYASTPRYNYGPIWFHILYVLYELPGFGGQTLNALHIKVALFLTCVDLGIFAWLLRYYSSVAALLFILNPISIIITGYHSQFDNFAILVALVAICYYPAGNDWRRLSVALVGIGLSLMVKHVLFLFPVWLALRESSPVRRLFILIVPYSVFLAGFIPYWSVGKSGIIEHVFLYRSFNNAPFWQLLLPKVALTALHPFLLFILALLVVGWIVRHESPQKTLLIYLISVVAFSSAVTNQYLADPMVALAASWNWLFVLYTLLGGLYLSVQAQGLHLAFLQNMLQWRGSSFTSYVILVWLLAVGGFKRLAQQGLVAPRLNLLNRFSRRRE